jgi:iron-sulfur cluster repair protein YtfE (RIC family)
LGASWSPERRSERKLRVLGTEHEAACSLTAKLRQLTDGFTPDTDACNTRRA